MKLVDKTILIIDDDDSFSRLVEKILQNIGMRTVIKKNITEALQYLNTDLPDLILLDINLPDYNGFSFLKARKTLKRLKILPVIIASVDLDDDAINEAMAIGATTYIKKPIEAKILIQKIKQIFLNWNDYVYKCRDEKIKIEATVECLLVEANDQSIVFESPVKFKDQTIVEAKILDLGEIFVCQCEERIMFNSGKNFKYFFKLHGVSDVQLKKLHEWRLKKLEK